LLVTPIHSVCHSGQDVGLDGCKVAGYGFVRDFGGGMDFDAAELCPCDAVHKVVVSRSAHLARNPI